MIQEARNGTISLFASGTSNRPGEVFLSMSKARALPDGANGALYLTPEHARSLSQYLLCCAIEAEDQLKNHIKTKVKTKNKINTLEPIGGDW